MAAPQNIIAQSKPAAITRTDLFSPGASRRARVTICASCQTATDDVQISIAPLAAAHAVSQVVAFDLAVSQDVPYYHDCYLEGTDLIRVYSTGGNVAFTVNGYEDDIPSA
jgi:hypothetical protein